MTGAPQCSRRFIATTFLDPVEDVWQPFALDGERPVLAVKVQAQRGERGAYGQLVATVHGRQPVRPGAHLTHRGVVTAEVNGWTQLQPDHLLAGNQAVVDEDRVLRVQQEHALVD